MNNLSLEDVRDYLFESNAIEEAESIILKNLLNNTKAPSKNQIDNDNILKSKNESQKTESKKIQNVQISDLLGSYEKKVLSKPSLATSKYQEEQAKEAEKKQAELLRNEKADSLYEFERVAQNELFELETRRQLMETKLIEKKKEMEKYDIIHNTNKRINNDLNDSSTAAERLAARNAVNSLSAQQEAAQKQLRELAEQHALRVSENKMKIMQTQRELELLSTGKYDFSSIAGKTASKPTIENATNSSNDDTGKAETVAVSAPVTTSNLGDDLLHRSRVDQIMSQVASEAELAEQAKRIEGMRAQAAQDVQALQTEPLFVSSPNKPASDKKVVLGGSKVDRNMTVNQYLDLWLEQETGAAADSVGTLPPPLPSVSNSSSTASLAQQNTNPATNSDSSKYNTASKPVQSSNPLMNSALQSIQSHHSNIQQALSDHQPMELSAARESADELIARLQRENAALKEEKVQLLQRDIRKQQGTSSPPRRDPSGPSSIDQFRQHANNHHNPYANPMDGAYGGYPHPSQQQGPNGFSNPYFPQPAFNNPYNPQQQHLAQQPFYPQQMMPQQPQHQLLLPQQQQQLAVPVDPMLAQMQRMTDQMERENQRLLSQLGGSADSVGSVGMDPLAAFEAQQQLLQQQQSGLEVLGGKPPPLYMMERDKVDAFGNKLRNQNKVNNSNNNSNNAGAGLTKDDVKYQSEIKAIQYEIEKLKYSSELDQLRSECQRAKESRAKESEHSSWLEGQRQELQALKMKQVLAKEQKLLRLQLEADGGGDSEVKRNTPDNKPSSSGGLTPLQLNSLREESGVGTVPLPLEMSKGIAVLVDGLLLAPKDQQGGYFRVALGIYDRAGKSVVRLTSTEWQGWSNGTAATNSSALITQHLGSVLMRTIKQSSSAPPTPGGSGGLDLSTGLLGSKCLVEIQSKADDAAAQKSLGWCMLSLTNSSGAVDTNICKDNASKNSNIADDTTVANNAWRGILRTGISDPMCDPTAPLSLADNYLENGWVAVRIVDSAESLRASSWALKEVPELRNIDAVLQFYKDPLNSDGATSNGSDSKAQQAVAASAKVNPSTRPESSSSRQGAVDSSKKIATPQAPPQSARITPSQQSMRPGSSSARPGTGMQQNPNTNSTASLKPPLGQLPEDDETNSVSNSSVKLRSGDDKLYWYMGTPSGPATERYQRGDGVDIYIDTAMFLPDNATLTRLTVKLYTQQKEQHGGNYEFMCDPNSPATSPSFLQKIEVRSGAVLNTTLTALVRIDTVEYSTAVPVSVGYVCFKVFCTRDRVQPKIASEPNAYINTGLFQLPVMAGRPPSATLTVFDDQMLSSLTKIPCASLLVRIVAAPKSADGISTLSRDEFPQEDWLRLGLDVPVPSYVSGAYNGALCEPSPSELTCYSAKSGNVPETAEVAFNHAISAKPAHSFSKAPEASGDAVKDAKAKSVWINSLFPTQMTRTLDFSLCVPYHVETGLHVSIDSLFNMPEGSLFNSTANLLHKVIVSLTPPGLFYKEPPLSDGLYYTKQHDFDRAFRAPGYLDSAFEFTPSELSDSVFLLLDIRTVKLDPNKTSTSATAEPIITVEPAGPRKSYWSLLPLGRERVLGQGHHYCQSGTFQLPLIEGSIPYRDLFKSSDVNAHSELKKRLSSKQKGGSSLKIVEGASVIVKIANPALAAVLTTSAEATMMQDGFMRKLLEYAEEGQSGAAARSDKFTYSVNKFKTGPGKAKTTLQSLPRINDKGEFSKAVNKAFEEKHNIASS